jgi:uncharacterized protein
MRRPLRRPRHPRSPSKRPDVGSAPDMTGVRAALALAACALFAGAAFSGPSGAQTLQPIPPFEARVTDLTGTLTPEQRQVALESNACASSRHAKGAQVAVLVVATTEPRSHRAVLESAWWRRGRWAVLKVDDGALLLVAKDDRAPAHRSGPRPRRRAAGSRFAKRIVEDIIAPQLPRGRLRRRHRGGRGADAQGDRRRTPPATTRPALQFGP